ncbi:MAG: hypothetical protein SFU56_01965 [Capsulimonadales bacterium]|nr:hypothetical protein [Capsulimonadales bacterium]
MNLWTGLRAFARFLGIEFRQVGEENLAASAPTAPEPTTEGKTLPPPNEPIEWKPFVPSTVLSRLPTMKPSELDNLDFGCVQVSDSGVVRAYNRWEADFAGVDQKAAIGRNFFRELAPCTNNRLIFGRFKEGVASDHLNTIVSYAFTYKMRPTLVRVHLYRDPDTRTNWVLVQKHEGVQGK